MSLNVIERMFMKLLTSGWHGGGTQTPNHLTRAKDEFCVFLATSCS